MQWLSRCCHSPIFKHKCVVVKVVLRQPNNLSTSCCHVTTSFYYTDHFKLGGEARPNENLGRRAHKNESGLLPLCSDWREVSDRFSWDIAEAIQHQAFATW